MKKEMILWFFFLVIFGVQASASSEHRHVTFTIGIPEEILPGINFPVRLIVTNNTLHPISLIFGKEGFSVSYTLTEEGSTKRIRCDSGIRYKRVPLLRKTHILLHPGESWKKNLFSFEDCSVTPGHRYCLDAMIQSRALPEPSWHVQFYWKGKKEIRRCIDYKVPTGVDRIVYKETNGCPMCKKEWVLKHYPTSTYTGWVLLGGEFRPLNPRAQKPYLTLRYYVPQPRWRDELHMKVLPLFLKAHPDFIGYWTLKIRYGVILWGFKRYKEAQEVFEEIIKKAPPSISQIGKQYKEAMERLLREKKLNVE